MDDPQEQWPSPSEQPVGKPPRWGAKGYATVLKCAIGQGLACGLVFAALGFSATAFLCAFLVAFAAVWLGFLCARWVARWRLGPDRTSIIGAGVGGLVGTASAFVFCVAIEVFPPPQILLVGAGVGLFLGWMNVQIWYDRSCL